MDPLKQGLNKAFIDRQLPSSALEPSLIINQPDRQIYLLNQLQEDLDRCQDFIFSVAFITQDGLNVLKSQLDDLAERDVSGRLLTSAYLNFNQPETFRALLKIPNLTVKISQQTGFHAKGYLFHHPDHSAFIIGSSNLTMRALNINYKWNMRLTSYDHGQAIHNMTQHLEDEWQAGQVLTAEWIDKYEDMYLPNQASGQMERLVAHPDQQNTVQEPSTGPKKFDCS